MAAKDSDKQEVHRRFARRIRNAELVGVPRPRDVGLFGSGPAFMRPLYRNYSDAPCAICPAYCCTFDVAANAVDLARIVLLLGVPPERVVVLDPEHASTVAKAVLIEGKPVQMLLRREQTEGIRKPVCHMLAWPGGKPRCGVYDARPGVCRVYPFRFVTDGNAEYAVGAPIMCPQQWAIEYKVQSAMEQEIVEWRDQLAYADRITKEWNAKHADQNAAAWFRFCIERGARKLKLDHRPYFLGQRQGLGKRLW